MMKISVRFAAAGVLAPMVLAFAGLNLFAQAKSAAKSEGPKLVAPRIPFEKYTLPNGLEVILSEDKALPIVAVEVWYHVGPAYEKAGKTGFAHLFEHMMFEGSKNVGEKQHFKYLEAAGASDVNGTTSFDRTNYFETLPSNQLELGLWLESDRMGFLLDTLDRAKLTNQRDVVRNERRQSRENVPYGLSEEMLYHNLFPESHPYYPVVMGSHADIEAARLNDVRDFFKSYYTPNNATLVIAGDFDKAKTKAMVEKYFGPLQKGPVVQKPTVPLPVISAEKKITVTDDVQLPQVEMAWLTPPQFAPGDAELDVAQEVVGTGKTSRMYQELVYKQQIAQSATCSHSSMALASIFSCELTARPGVTPEKLQAAADTVLEQFLKDGPTAAEMQRAKLRIVGNLIRPLESVGSVADTLASYNETRNDPGYLPKDIARYEAVTPAAVLKYAQSALGTNQRVVVTTVAGEKKVNDVPRSPENTDADVKITPEYTAEFNTSQAWRKNAPPAGPTPQFTLPKPETFTLSNGLQVLVTERHKLPLFAAGLYTLGGADSDVVTKPGVSGFTAAMLTEGTKSRTSTQIANDAASIGAGIGSSASIDSSITSVNGLSVTTPQAMDLLADVALHPAFDAKEVERVRARRLTSLLQSRDEAMSVAQRVGARALYGKDSPYGYSAQGTEASVKGIKPEDLSGFWQAHYAPKNAVLVFAGDITVAQAKDLATKYFGGWTNTVAATPVPSPVAAETHKVILVDKPGAPQTALLTYQVGVPRSTPDYAPIEVMNTMLGGLFSARINMNLREEHGYTYGAFSQFAFRRGPGPFIAGASVRTDVTAPAAKELFKELNRIHTEPLNDAELKMAKDSVIRSLPGQFEGNGSLVGAMAGIWIYGLPADYYQTLPARLEAVTSDQAAKAAADHIKPEQMLTVVVGDKAKIESGMKDLGLGPIEEWTPDAELKK